MTDPRGPARACRYEGLQRTQSIIHRRGDSFSSLRSEDGAADGGPDARGPRPIFFMHGVGLGLVSLERLNAFACQGLPLPPIMP